MTTSPERPAEAAVAEAAVPDDLRTVLLNRVSWGAVLAGVVTALVVQLLLDMLGLGIGLGTLGAAGGDNPSPTTFSVGAGLWWTLSGIVASFLGGAMAGRLCGKPSASTGGWHGVVTWAATTLVISYLLTTALGGVLGGAFSVLGNAASAVGRSAASRAFCSAWAAVCRYCCCHSSTRLPASSGLMFAALASASTACPRAACASAWSPVSVPRTYATTLSRSAAGSFPAVAARTWRSIPANGSPACATAGTAEAADRPTALAALPSTLNAPPSTPPSAVVSR